MDIRSASPLLTAATNAAHRGAIQQLLRGSIPALADFAFVFVAVGSVITCVASAHATTEGTRIVRALRRIYRVGRSNRSSTVAQVLRGGRPLLRTDIQLEPSPASSVDPVMALHRRLAPRSALTVPIAAGRKVLGAVSLCYSQSGRSYTPADVPSASRLAAQIAHLLAGKRPADATRRLRAAARHARQGTTIRRRVAARD